MDRGGVSLGDPPPLLQPTSREVLLDADGVHPLQVCSGQTTSRSDSLSCLTSKSEGSDRLADRNGTSVKEELSNGSDSIEVKRCSETVSSISWFWP
jgi:hypothetical protein